jgi:hypothetical protein
MSNSANVTGGKPIAVCSQSILVEIAINSLVAFYDIHGRTREVLFFYFVPDTTQPFLFVRELQKIELQRNPKEERFFVSPVWHRGARRMGRMPRILHQIIN